MASIIGTKRTKEGIVLEVKADYKEYLELEGHMDKIYLFAEKEDAIRTHISQRGKNGATKYFLIPRNLRKGMGFNSQISCYKIDRNDVSLFLYVVDKFKTAAKNELRVNRSIKLEQASE